MDGGGPKTSHIRPPLSSRGRGLPFDLIPDVIPIVGEIDDLVVLVLAARWFMQWCPPDVVREHVRAMAAGRPARAG